MKMKTLLCCMLAALMLTAGCAGPEHTPKPSHGPVEPGDWMERTYENQSLGLALTISDEWVIGDADAVQSTVLEAVQSELSGEAAHYLLKASRYDASDITAYPMIQIAAHALDAIEEYAADEKEYLELIKHLIGTNSIDALGDIITENLIDGVLFYILSLEVYEKDGLVTYHTLMASERNGNMLLIAVSYLDQQQYLEALDILASITLE
jgi:hypothetical protein